MVVVPRFTGQTIGSYEEAEQRSHGGLQAEFGEEFTILPMKKVPNKSPLRDKTRSTQTLKGIYCSDTRSSGMDLNETKVDTFETSVTFQKCDMRGPIYQGDLARRCKDGTVFEIKQTKPDAESGLLCELFQMGVPEQ